MPVPPDSRKARAGVPDLEITSAFNKSQSLDSQFAVQPQGILAALPIETAVGRTKPPGHLVTQLCEHCGRALSARSRGKAGRTRRFCSAACRVASSREKLLRNASGHNHPSCYEIASKKLDSSTSCETKKGRPYPSRLSVPIDLLAAAVVGENSLARGVCAMTELIDTGAVERLAKLCGMFGSAHDGERASAAAMADKLVRSLGLSWGEIIQTRTTETIPEKIGLALANVDALSV
jgi:hypothetical protein